VSEPTPFKYRAFLSYSHRDKLWAKWLHAALESHRIDKDLFGRATAAGPVPKTLRPIFRDREDFSAGHSLTEHTLAALEAAQFLIVVCSQCGAKRIRQRGGAPLQNARPCRARDSGDRRRRLRLPF
jgi:hypothetical protein